ncbi:RNA polymerase sigma factor [Xanthomonas arboricola]|uniref:RNA polymerase sigma factor n=1 Tax=Xanthomonas arboricola TaxID=56448 RepID=UPI0017DBFCFC|nr:hypothetical protein [Xanthomonas arboricola]
MVNDTLAGALGTFPRFGSTWMPLPVERATNTCTAWHRRSASGTTTTRMAYVAPLRAASMGGYTRIRHTTRRRVREEPAAGRARFDQAIGLLHADLLAYMRRRLRDPNTADDLTQETLLRLLAYRDAPDIGDYALLMYRIAHNVVLEYWRTRHRRHANAHVALDLIAPLAADGATSTRSPTPAASCSTCTPTRCLHYRPDAARPSSSTASTASPTRKWPQPWTSRSRWWKSTSAAHWLRAGPLCSDAPGLRCLPDENIRMHPRCVVHACRCATTSKHRCKLKNSAEAGLMHQ